MPDPNPELKAKMNDEAWYLRSIARALRQIHATLRQFLTLAEGLEAAEAEGREKAAELETELVKEGHKDDS